MFYQLIVQFVTDSYNFQINTAGLLEDDNDKSTTANRRPLRKRVRAAASSMVQQKKRIPTYLPSTPTPQELIMHGESELPSNLSSTTKAQKAAKNHKHFAGNYGLKKVGTCSKCKKLDAIFECTNVVCAKIKEKNLCQQCDQINHSGDETSKHVRNLITKILAPKANKNVFQEIIYCDFCDESFNSSNEGSSYRDEGPKLSDQ